VELKMDIGWWWFDGIFCDANEKKCVFLQNCKTI
jgi:hypothetical protein